MEEESEEQSDDFVPMELSGFLLKRSGTFSAQKILVRFCLRSSRVMWLCSDDQVRARAQMDAEPGVYRIISEDGALVRDNAYGIRIESVHNAQDSAERAAAAINGNAAFFAPLIGICPLSGVPPLITNLSIKIPSFHAGRSEQHRPPFRFTLSVHALTSPRKKSFDRECGRILGL